MEGKYKVTRKPINSNRQERPTRPTVKTNLNLGLSRVHNLTGDSFKSSKPTWDFDLRFDSRLRRSTVKTLVGAAPTTLPPAAYKRRHSASLLRYAILLRERLIVVVSFLTWASKCLFFFRSLLLEVVLCSLSLLPHDPPWIAQQNPASMEIPNYNLINNTTKLDVCFEWIYLSCYIAWVNMIKVLVIYNFLEVDEKSWAYK